MDSALASANDESAYKTTAGKEIGEKYWMISLFNDAKMQTCANVTVLMEVHLLVGSEAP